MQSFFFNQQANSTSSITNDKHTHVVKIGATKRCTILRFSSDDPMIAHIINIDDEIENKP